MTTKVYLDSCIVIYLLEGSESLVQTVSSALAPKGEQRRSVASSDLVRLECRVGPLKNTNLELLARFDQFFASADLVKVPLTADVFNLATELRATHGTKTPDAIHLAAAVLEGCAELWTNDHRLQAAAAERIGLRVLP